MIPMQEFNIMNNPESVPIINVTNHVGQPNILPVVAIINKQTNIPIITLTEPDDDDGNLDDSSNEESNNIDDNETGQGPFIYYVMQRFLNNAI